MKAYGLTDIGKNRTQNQDYLYLSTEAVGGFSNLFLLADGMGGHKAGNYASRFVVENLLRYIEQSASGAVIPVLDSGIKQVNDALFQDASRDEGLHGTGTTLVAATVDEGVLCVANVGDSRLYLFRDAALRQITRDHSYVEELVARGEMERGSEEYLKKKNIITRAIGSEPGVYADFFDEELRTGDLLLLCSDGLTNMVSENEIAQCLTQEKPLEDKVQELIDLANAHGGKDNITVIVADPQISEVIV